MNFRISDTFTDSLAKLTGEEQKAAKLTAFELQLDPANPGMCLLTQMPLLNSLQQVQLNLESNSMSPIPRTFGRGIIS